MVTFNFTYDAGVTTQQALGFEFAGRIWSHYLSDPITLNIHVGLSSTLPAGVIGGALPGILPNVSYGSVVNPALSRDQRSTNDRTAFQNVFNTGNTVNVDYVIPTSKDDIVISSSASTLNLTRANAKAIGALAGNDLALDGIIVMGTLMGMPLRWDYDFLRANKAPDNTLDFLSVALHEIGHVMGFISGVDLPGWDFKEFKYEGVPTNIQQILDERTQFLTPLDRLRFSDSKLVDTNDLSYGKASGDKFFAMGINDDQIAKFSMGKNAAAGGDGYQASHWEEESKPLGIMDPALSVKQRVSISNLDLQAFDVIGWDLRNGLNAISLTPQTLLGIYNQAASSLAQQLGQTTAWVLANHGLSPSRMARNRMTDINSMITNSQIYEGRRGSGSTGTTTGIWMEVFNQMANAQEVYVNFSTVSDLPAPSDRSTPARRINRGNAGNGRRDNGNTNWNLDDLLGMRINAGSSRNLTSDSADFLTSDRGYSQTENPFMQRSASRDNSRFDVTQSSFWDMQSVQLQSLDLQIADLEQRSLGALEENSSSGTFWKHRGSDDLLREGSAITGADNPVLERIGNPF